MLRARVTVCVLLFLSLMAAVSSVQAAWWEASNFPAPVGAKATKTEKRSFAGVEFQMRFYESDSLEASGIKDFYRKRLPALGWKEMDIEQELSKVPGYQGEVSLGQYLENKIVFLKEGRMLNVVIMPRQLSGEGKTKFLVSEGLQPFEQARMDATSSGAAAITSSPVIKDMPQYPGSKSIGAKETEYFALGIFLSNDKPEPILAFFKNALRQKNWTLQEETPLQQTDTAAFRQLYKIDDGDSTSGDSGAVPKGAYANLDFTNAAGKTCRINVFRASPDDVSAQLMSETTVISVRYEKSKE